MATTPPKKTSVFRTVHKLAHEWLMGASGNAPPAPKQPKAINKEKLQERLVTLGLATTNGDPIELISHETGEEEFVPLPQLKDLKTPELHLVAELVKELELSYEYGFRLGRDAYFDLLTGLFNRRAAFYHFNRTIRDMEIEQRHGEGVQPVCIALFDVDKLHDINDKRGYDAGDLLIQHVGRILKEQMPACKVNPLGKSTISRYGGDEFLVILRGVTPEQAQEYVTAVEVEVESKPYLIPRGTQPPRDYTTIPKGVTGQQTAIVATDTLQAITTNLHTRVKQAKSPGSKIDMSNTLAHTTASEARFLEGQRLDVHNFSDDGPGGSRTATPDDNRGDEDEGPGPGVRRVPLPNRPTNPNYGGRYGTRFSDAQRTKGGDGNNPRGRGGQGSGGHGGPRGS